MIDNNYLKTIKFDPAFKFPMKPNYNRLKWKYFYS